MDTPSFNDKNKMKNTNAFIEASSESNKRTNGR
jgi:hypothetical protein